MSAARPVSGMAQRVALPRRTVRLRLTALYGGLFLASGAGLLAITNILARSWPWPEPGPAVVAPAGVRVARFCTFTHPSVCYSPAQLQAQAAAGHAAALNQLLAESAIALAVMTVVSAMLGWLMAGRVLRPLRAMTAAARAVSADDLAGGWPCPARTMSSKTSATLSMSCWTAWRSPSEPSAGSPPAPRTSCAPR